jgi:hypothetical protein
MSSRLLAWVRQQPIAILALFVALGGSSYAAVSADGSGRAKRTIYGCVGENTGRLRIVDSPIRCGSLESPISFNREGERGPKGNKGNPGRRGPAGAPGAASTLAGPQARRESRVTPVAPVARVTAARPAPPEATARRGPPARRVSGA